MKNCVKKEEKRLAFTLAEVLIVLGIVGVIAEMTIPTLISNFKKTETETKIKKVYTTFMQAAKLSSIDNGPIEYWLDASAPEGGARAEEFAEKYVIPYISVLKKCGLSTTGDCNYGAVNYLTPGSGSTTDTFGSEVAKYYIKDGTFIGFQKSTSGGNELLLLVFDIDGPKKGLNTFGKDVFYIDYWIKPGTTTGMLVPNGIAATKEYLLTTGGCNKTGGNGINCIAVIAKDGWIIEDDYPW